MSQTVAWSWWLWRDDGDGGDVGEEMMTMGCVAEGGVSGDVREVMVMRRDGVVDDGGPKRPRNAAWFKKKEMLAEALESGQILDEEQLAFLADPCILDGQAAQTTILNIAAFLTEDLDAYDFDYDDVLNAKAVLMANLSNYGFDVIFKLDTFYNALNPNDQDALDSAAEGNFLDKIPRECLAIIESKSKVRYSRSRVTDSREVKNVMEQPTERGTRIEKSLQNFRVIHKISISLKDTSQISSVHAIASILSTKVPEYSLSMEYEHPNTTLETESDEIIKSGVEELVQILSENEVTSEDKRECDVPVCENSPICNDHSEIFSDSKNDNDEQCGDTPSISYNNSESLNKVDLIDAGENILFLERLLSEDPFPLMNPNQAKSFIKEPEHSFSMGYEHFSTPLVTEIDEVAKSSIKNLVPILRECEVTSDNERESNEPVKDDSLVFTTFSNPLFNDNESIHEDDVPIEESKVFLNSLFDNDEINSDELESHVKSNSVESLSNHDTVKFDHLEEFSGPLIPNHIAKEERIRKEHAEYISRMEMLFTINPRPHPTMNANTIVESIPSSLIPIQDNESQREEINIVTNTDELLPQGFENDDSEGEIDVAEELHEPLDVEFNFKLDAGDEILVVINTIDEFESLNPRDEFDVFNDENDDYFPFMFVIWSFIPYLIYSKMFLSFLSAESEDTIFDPGISLLELVVSHWDFPFMYVIWSFISHLIYSKMFLSFLSAESEDTIFDHESHVESNFVESTSNHDTVKFDNLDEFFGPFIPIHIAKEERIRMEHADYINRMEMLFTINPRRRPTVNANTNVESIPSLPIPIQDNDSQREEIDIITSTDDVLPLGVENNDSDREVVAVDDLRVDNSILNSEYEFSESEESNFDNPSVLLPPSEPPDKEFDFEIDFEMKFQ
nr:reverse transcriptase domain-containing protein [Tanacetum cinerariifolium]